MKNFKFKINGNEYEVEIHSVEGNIAEVEVNGSIYKVEIDKEMQVTKTPKLVRPVSVPSTDTPKIEEHKTIPAPTSKEGQKILSPLPGVILDVLVHKGDKVSIGQKVAILEAMKMENNIESDIEGTVIEVKVNKGDSIMQGDVIVVIG
ncbi:MAG: acetyl-CoA carboxylase biotin carboxyl carrier protein subunit [Bacteroidales bacterium]|nr:acetyl-CoA carboxylase biotin carboxyl carrier protein subunit [Bacteroidales bacterium]